MEPRSDDSKRAISTVRERLTDWFEDYLSENIGDDILSCYYDGFTVGQVVQDLDEAIKQWANEDTKLEALREIVDERAAEYTSEADEF